jgi:hypothetical protein
VTSIVHYPFTLITSIRLNSLSPKESEEEKALLLTFNDEFPIDDTTVHQFFRFRVVFNYKSVVKMV